jgi:hypothetical protein
MDAFELKDRLAEKLGEAESRELLSYINSRGEYAERVARMEDKIDKQTERLTRVETKAEGITNRLDRQQTSFLWLIGISLTAVGLLVGILIKIL